RIEADGHLQVGFRGGDRPDEGQTVRRPEILVDPQVRGLGDAEGFLEEAQQAVDALRLLFRVPGAELSARRDQEAPPVALRRAERAGRSAAAEVHAVEA